MIGRETMIIDRLISIAERYKLGGLDKALANANIFEIHPESISDVDYKGTIQKKRDMFTMPFDDVIVSLPSSKDTLAGIICDTPGAIGVSQSRHFCTIVKTDNPEMPNSYGIVMGQIHDLVPSTTNSQISSSLARGLIVNDKTIIADTEGVHGKLTIQKNQFIEAIMGDNIGCIYWPYMYLVYFRSLDRFVVKSEPRDPRKIPKGRIARSDNRPTYTLLRDSEIAERYYTPPSDKSDRKSPDPHARIRHWRRKRKELGWIPENMLDIPSTWVGPSDFVKGGKTYKVLTSI